MYDFIKCMRNCICFITNKRLTREKATKMPRKNPQLKITNKKKKIQQKKTLTTKTNIWFKGLTQSLPQ